ncbi:MAG: isochorismatase family protein [Hyphomicrobiaceae bacterium]
MPHDVLSSEFRELIEPNAAVQRLCGGFEFTEGPIWHPTQHYLLFSDMPGDVRRRWTAHGGVQETARPANKCNGMTYDAQLNLLVCEHATSSLVRESPNGQREVMASHFEDKQLNSPNDVVVRSDGSIYFTDPWYGRMPVYGVERPRELGWQGVFRVPPGGGALQLVVDRSLFDMPNGLCFSPDESLLYINDTAGALIRVFEVNPDGTLRRGRIFATGIRSDRKAGVPDGMKCDAKGNVWVTGPGGVRVYSPGGRHIGTVRVPEMVANLHWGGVDWSTLFMTSTTSVYAVSTLVGPRQEPFMSAALPQTFDDPKDDEMTLVLDPNRCALIIQDLQNDVIMDGGAFADSGAPVHARSQNVIENVRRLAEVCRRTGVIVIHVWFVVDQNAPGLTRNAPLFDGLADANAVVRGSWGAAAVDGLEQQAGDFVVEKMRMSAWEGTTLETILKARGRNVIINTGAWTNMSVEHTARTGADKGYIIVQPEDCCSTMNADWHNASINYALQHVAHITNAETIITALQGQ